MAPAGVAGEAAPPTIVTPPRPVLFAAALAGEITFGMDVVRGGGGKPPGVIGAGALAVSFGVSKTTLVSMPWLRIFTRLFSRSIEITSTDPSLSPSRKIGLRT